jgi:NADH-quinone oxidoreductase subunit J
MGLNSLLFGLIAALALSSALCVVVTRNTVYAALYFVFHLLCLAALYAFHHAPILGALQVMVYAGAVMILFVFAVMILDLHQQETQDLAEHPGQLAAAGGLTLLLWGLFFGFSDKFQMASALAPAGDPAKPSLSVDNIDQIARLLFRDYALAFESVGVLLLLAVVAVMVMAKRKLES